jgi:hypothetical protein
VYSLPLGGGVIREGFSIGGEHCRTLWRERLSGRSIASHRIASHRIASHRIASHSFHFSACSPQEHIFTTGSGSGYIYGFCDSHYKPRMSKAEAIEFVRNGTPSGRYSTVATAAHCGNATQRTQRHTVALVRMFAQTAVAATHAISRFGMAD